MSLLDEIRQQSLKTRQWMFGLCVVTTLSLIGLVWFNSFQSNLIALMNPPKRDETNFAQNQNDNSDSLFANIAKSFKELTVSMKASVGNLFGNHTSSNNINVQNKSESNSEIKAHPLPLSGEK